VWHIDVVKEVKENMNNITVNILDVYGLNIVGRYVGLPVNKVLSDVHPDDQHIPAHKLNTLTKLIAAGDEHASIMRHVNAHLLIQAPRYWWVQWDKYRAGMEMYSGSTMHTLMKRPSTDDDFTPETSPMANDNLTQSIATGLLVTAKANLPEGYLQTRLILVSYQTLRRVWLQRRGHKLPEWAEFIRVIWECPYADELIFVEPRNPWRKLWERVLMNIELPWVWSDHRDGLDCAFCHHQKPGHKPDCLYAKAQAMMTKEIANVVTE
jgi:hypothetical protein